MASKTEASKLLDKHYGILPQSKASQALNTRANADRREALALKVNSLVSQKEEFQTKKDHLAQRVRDALIAAAQADPLKDFSCGCTYHEDAVETPTGLIASIVWANGSQG